jgi:hypothetical protein
MNDTLRTIKWELYFGSTITSQVGKKIDMYYLAVDMGSDKREGISLGVPHGRDDIAMYVFRACLAGQAVLQRIGTDDVTQFWPIKKERTDN